MSNRPLLALKILTAIRLRRPELWAEICKFAKSFQDEGAVSRKDRTLQENGCAEVGITVQDQDHGGNKLPRPGENLREVEKHAQKFFGEDPRLPVTFTSRKNLPA